jgi:hypothetical protein
VGQKITEAGHQVAASSPLPLLPCLNSGLFPMQSFVLHLWPQSALFDITSFSHSTQLHSRLCAAVSAAIIPKFYETTTLKFRDRIVLKDEAVANSTRLWLSLEKPAPARLFCLPVFSWAGKIMTSHQFALAASLISFNVRKQDLLNYLAASRATPTKSVFVNSISYTLLH